VRKTLSSTMKAVSGRSPSRPSVASQKPTPDVRSSTQRSSGKARRTTA
jgi:hypothetical protein